MRSTCNLWHYLINGFIITLRMVVRDGGVRRRKAGGGLESYVIRCLWKLVLQCHGHLMSLIWEQIWPDGVIKAVWLRDTLEDETYLVWTWWQSFGIFGQGRGCSFSFQFKNFQIMLSKNRKWLVELISICSPAPVVIWLRSFDSDIKGVRREC